MLMRSQHYGASDLKVAQWLPPRHSLTGAPQSRHRPRTAVGRDESVADRTAVASAGGSTRPLRVTGSSGMAPI